MIIEVFGEYINPQNIAYLDYKIDRDCYIVFNAKSDKGRHSISIYGKTKKEVADEINAQIFATQIAVEQCQVMSASKIREMGGISATLAGETTKG